MNSRAEAGLAASLALVKISVETAKKTDKNFAKVLYSQGSSNIFMIPSYIP